MADPKQQYLKLSFGGGAYLLPSTVGYTIEQRDNLQLNDVPSSRVGAWRIVRGSRWPAYALDEGFRPARGNGWQRAVFIEAIPHAIGVIVHDVHLLARGQAQITPYTPLGPTPTRVGHLFTGAWATEEQVMLVLDPRALVAFLQGLGD